MTPRPIRPAAAMGKALRWRNQLGRSTTLPLPPIIGWLLLALSDFGVWWRTNPNVVSRWWGTDEVVGRVIHVRGIVPRIVGLAVVTLAAIALTAWAFVYEPVFAVGGILVMLVGVSVSVPLVAAWQGSRAWDGDLDLWSQDLMRDPAAPNGVGARFSRARWERIQANEPEMKTIGFRAGNDRLAEHWAGVYPEAEQRDLYFRVPHTSTTPR